MQGDNNSFPRTYGKEFLFCGISGIPVGIRSWCDSIEVPTTLLGYGDRGFVTLVRENEKASSINVVGAKILDTRRVLHQKLDNAKTLGICVELSTASEVWSNGSIIDEVAEVVEGDGYKLSHAYVLDKKLVFCTPYCDVLEGVDEVVLLRHAILNSSEKLGITSSFMPISGGGRCGFGVRLRIKGERSIVTNFCAGVILHSPECTVFTNSSHPSYVRLNSSGCAHYVCYGNTDGALFKIEFQQDDLILSCNYADNTGNPYLLIASLIEGGIMGVDHQAKLPDEVEELNPTVTSRLVRLPMSLKEALTLSEGSGFLKRLLGESYANLFFAEKRKECKVFDTVVGEGEYAVYYSKLTKKR